MFSLRTDVTNLKANFCIIHSQPKNALKIQKNDPIFTKLGGELEEPKPETFYPFDKFWFKASFSKYGGFKFFLGYF